jgi:hypothetical protein
MLYPLSYGAAAKRLSEPLMGALREHPPHPTRH